MSGTYRRAVAYLIAAAITLGAAGFTIDQVEFCSHADSFTYCIRHLDKGDDVRLGA